jgi:hypothetical protein
MMVIEIVRSAIAPDREAEVLASRPHAMARFRESFPALRSATLARFDDGTWVDLLIWDSRADAQEAARRAAEIPELAAFMALLGSVSSFEIATIVHVVPDDVDRGFDVKGP